MNNIRSVAIWGDSVMKGVVYDDLKGRYVLLPECGADKASKTLGLTLRNRSRMGCTVTKGLQIMKKDLQTGVEGDVALLEFGGNDCDYDWAQVAERPQEQHLPKTPLHTFIAQLREMVRLARQRGMEPVMMSLPPIHAQRYFDFFTRDGLSRDNILLWLGDIQFIYRWHERYNTAVMRVAQECGCLLADVREAFLGQRHYEDLLCADGIHPNEKGHSLMESVLESFGAAVRPQLAAAE